MFISKVVFPRERLSTLMNVYKMHQNMFSIVSKDAGGKRNFIYRVFEDKGHAIIISEKEPEGTMLANLHVQTKPFVPHLVDNRKYRFSIKFASVKRFNGKEKAVLDREESIKLLNSKLVNGGAAKIISAEATISGFDKVKKHKSGFDIPSSEITGILEVVDSENLLRFLRLGVGRKKGFGFGMLMLMPA